MKVKLLVVFLFLCIVAPLISIFTLYHLSQKQIKKEIKHKIISKINLKDLVLLKFSKNELLTKLEWEHDLEFEFNHQMYDVVKSIEKPDSMYYWCLLDNKETKLNKKLELLLAKILRNKSTQKNKQKRLGNFYNSLFCEHFNKLNFISYLISQKKRYVFTKYHSFTLPPPFPPPKYC